MMHNERGIALIITLLVVALLTITVVEFTYSVEVDQHMARNALSGLQATLLARSGINMGEAFLLHDDDPLVDAFTEEWCPSPGPEGYSCRIDETNSQLVVPDNMRLRVQILDESGKFNINVTRPRSVALWRAWRTWKNQNADPKTAPVVEAWKNVLANILAQRGVGSEVADAVLDYWDQLYEAQFGDQGTPGVTGTPAMATPTPVSPGSPTPAPNAAALAILDLPSLDDASVIPGLTPAAIRHLRPVLTALDSNRMAQVNINTAPREVLSAIIGDDSIVGNIVSQRQNNPLKQQDLGALLAGLDRTDPTKKYAPQMLGVRSSYFLVRASAIVNPDPISGRGGITRSASMLVRRDQKPGVPPNAPAGTPRWTLTQLDWQKEGGAVLFQSRVDGEPGTDDPNSPMTSDLGG